MMRIRRCIQSESGPNGCIWRTGRESSSEGATGAKKDRTASGGGCRCTGTVFLDHVMLVGHGVELH